MINGIISAVLQIIIFTLIPFFVYLFQNKSTKGFAHYIGLKKSNKKANLWALLLCLLIGGPLILMGILNTEFFSILTDPESVSGSFYHMDLSAETGVMLFIAAVFKTSLSEEILFRGFIAKRFIAWTNYKRGNIMQAVIFGAIHMALFLTFSNNILFLTIIFLVPAVGAYFMVYLNEKVADGSIIPGWIAHALANIISYSVIGFLI
jgi:membrane protease YdiL (CAAX protease family)